MILMYPIVNIVPQERMIFLSTFTLCGKYLVPFLLIWIREAAFFAVVIYTRLASIIHFGGTEMETKQEIK